MQFQVPQFIETEDKIVGPLSLRQFFYFAAAGAISFTLFFAVERWLWIILSLFLAGAGASFAFVKINGRPLLRVLFSIFSFYWNPQTYVWRPEEPATKKEEALRDSREGMFERFVSGLALKNTWRALQTGTRAKPRPTEHKGRFELVRRVTGERKVARRVDYR